MKAKISFSIADAPYNIPTETLFRLASELEIDGVEVFIGFKTRYPLEKLKKLAEKYHITILSVHQPAWSFLGLYKDEQVFSFASRIGALYNAHPIHWRSLTATRSRQYFLWLAKMSKKYGVTVSLENLPKQHVQSVFKQHVVRVHSSTSDLTALKKVCDEFGFGATIDVCHLGVERPHTLPEFKVLEHIIKDIHLSDYRGTKQHLAIGHGIMDTAAFLQHLKKIQYNGLLTLELTAKNFHSTKEYLAQARTSISFIKENYNETSDALLQTRTTRR